MPRRPHRGAQEAGRAVNDAFRPGCGAGRESDEGGPIDVHRLLHGRCGSPRVVEGRPSGHVASHHDPDVGRVAGRPTCLVDQGHVVDVAERLRNHDGPGPDRLDHLLQLVLAEYWDDRAAHRPGGPDAVSHDQRLPPVGELPDHHVPGAHTAASQQAGEGHGLGDQLTPRQGDIALDHCGERPEFPLVALHQGLQRGRRPKAASRVRAGQLVGQGSGCVFEPRSQFDHSVSTVAERKESRR